MSAHVVLPATVEAAADLDVQILNGLVQLVSSSAMSRFRSSAARPRDEEMPSLQVSVPGQATMSRMLLAPGSLRPIASSAWYSAGTSDLLTQRITKFCSTVVRIVPLVNSRAMSASAA